MTVGVVLESRKAYIFLKEKKTNGKIIIYPRGPSMKYVRKIFRKIFREILRMYLMDDREFKNTHDIEKIWGKIHWHKILLQHLLLG